MSMTRTTIDVQGIPCYKYVNADSEEPVVGIGIFQHGWDERGVDLSLLENLPIPKLFADDTKTSNMVWIAPQLNTKYTEWPKGQHFALIDHLRGLQQDLGVDVHATGLSLGGYSTIGIVNRAKERIGSTGFFKSAGIVCGRTSLTDVSAFVDTEIKLWHGTQDEENSYTNIVNFYKRLVAAGVKVEFKTYEGYGHDIWNLVYDPEGTEYWSFVEKFATQAEGDVDEAGTGYIIRNGNQLIIETAGNQYRIEATVTKL